MSTAISHAFVALMLGKIWTEKARPLKFWILSIACSIMPDIDSIGFFLGIKYNAVMGHRGFCHSLLFAIIFSFFVVSLAFKDIEKFSKLWWAFIFYFFLVTASHGFIDAMTDGGLGVAFFSPFDVSRFFLPWRPLKAPSLNIAKLGSTFTLVLIREVVFIWIPMILIFVILKYFKNKDYDI